MRELVNMRKAYGEALVKLGETHPQVVVLSADVSNSDHSYMFQEAYPERFFNIGIAESNLACIGAGIAACGLIPFIVSFSSFLLCNAYDQIRLSIALSNVNAKVVGSHGGITLGKDGPTQMGIEDFALVGGMPTFVMLVPSDPMSMHWAVKAAADHVGPVFLRSSRVAMPHIYDEKTVFEIGRANMVREGDDLTIFGCGLMTSLGLDAAAELAEDGIEARVVDMHTLRPMDREAIISAARETGAIVTAEEHLLTGGMGSNIARIVAENAPVPMRFVGLADTYVESADPDDLLVKYHLTEADIVKASREVLGAKGE